MLKEERIIELSESIMKLFEEKGRLGLSEQQLRDSFNNDEEWSAYNKGVFDYIGKNKWAHIKKIDQFLYLTEEGEEYLDNKK